ncbi:MAG TPA: hypothetical protein ACFCUD_07960 [Cyclobacteriaceae bacterium]
MRLIVPTFLFSLISISLSGQFNNLRCKWIKTNQDSIILDSLIVVPKSIEFQNTSVEYEFDVNSGVIKLHDHTISDSLRLCYRVLNLKIGQKFSYYDLNAYDSSAYFKTRPIKNNDIYQKDELLPIDGINKTGTLTRGISFGNRQNIVVNSTLNLQLDGSLTDDLNIRAAITDQNIPFQPEGNTQQLQDFDNVYIQVYNDTFDLTAGDVVLRNKKNYFLRYYKNVQGGQASVTYPVGDNGKATTSAAFSVAKGKFASIQIEAVEGLQGPYRVRIENQRFITIIANSEKVFLDGKQLERGFNNDYVIDYNLGEITFNNNILITQFSRIRVDFEYADQNYSRSIMAADHYHQQGKFNAYFNFYQEKDNENRPLIFDLSNEEKQQLSESGDGATNAVISGVDSVSFDEDAILYRKTDTIDQDGKATEIFVFSRDPDDAFFRVSFSEVGTGNGNYERTNTSINGVAYKWISPINGTPQGSFEPVISVPLPNQRQMITFGTGYDLNEKHRIYSHMALSTRDENLFSDLDEADDQGYALKLGYQFIELETNLLDGYKWSGSVDYEFDNKNFQTIDRFRYIEFDRDWNFNPNVEAQTFNDIIINAQTELKKDAKNRVSYKMTSRKRGTSIDGFQHNLTAMKKIRNWQASSKLFIMNNNHGSRRSEWTRWDLDVHYGNKFIIPGYQYSIDRNKTFNTENDSIVNSAMNFEEHKIYFRSADSLKTSYQISYSLRDDRMPREGELKAGTAARTLEGNIKSHINENQSLEVDFKYRTIEDLRTDTTEENIMGRIAWQASFLDQSIVSDLTYSTINSQELRREFVFVPVQTGEGTHTWRDLNEDGVQDLSEFFIAVNFDEKNFIKVFSPTDDFITAFNTLFDWRLRLKSPKKWREKSMLLKGLSKFSSQLSFNSNKKVTTNTLNARFNPFLNNIRDLDIISLRNALRSTIYFNRGSAKYSSDLIIFRTRGKQQLTQGIESTASDVYTFNNRFNLNRFFSLQVLTSIGNKVNSSDFLEGREFDIHSMELSPKINWQPNLNQRLSFSYSFRDSHNRIQEDDNNYSRLHELIMEWRLARQVTRSLTSTFRFTQIDFDGEENSFTGYELLEGLRPGQNFNWTINYRQRLTNGILINFVYEGRKSLEQEVIHTGRMQVTALF